MREGEKETQRERGRKRENAVRNEEVAVLEEGMETMLFALVGPQLLSSNIQGSSSISTEQMNSISKEICQTWWLYQELCRKIIMNARKINKGKFRKHN